MVHLAHYEAQELLSLGHRARVPRTVPTTTMPRVL